MLKKLLNAVTRLIFYRIDINFAKELSRQDRRLSKNIFTLAFYYLNQ